MDQSTFVQLSPLWLFIVSILGLVGHSFWFRNRFRKMKELADEFGLTFEIHVAKVMGLYIINWRPTIDEVRGEINGHKVVINDWMYRKGRGGSQVIIDDKIMKTPFLSPGLSVSSMEGVRQILVNLQQGIVPELGNDVGQTWNIRTVATIFSLCVLALIAFVYLSQRYYH